jgi:hypothetical protein
MNTHLESLTAHLGCAPNDPIPTKSVGRIHLSPLGHVLVQVRPLLNAIFANVPAEVLDRRALYSQMTGKSDRDAAKRIDGRYYRHYGALKEALHRTLRGADQTVTAALENFPWVTTEDELYGAAKAALRATVETWAAKAQAKAAKAELLLSKKRAFDKAFEAAPATGPLVERPAKVARKDADEASLSSFSPSAALSSELDSSDNYESDDDDESSSSASSDGDEGEEDDDGSDSVSFSDEDLG